jgi:hypothetical protein
MLIAPIQHVAAIDKADLNRCLVAWGHRMGPWTRPDYGGPWFHAMHHHGEPVAVAAAGTLITKRAAGFSRDEAFELGRVCAVRPHLCRAMLRLWREFVFPDLCRAYGWRWVISYQDEALHSGNLYRHDGWLLVGHSSSGTDKRSGRKGRSKAIWGWCADPAEMTAR